MCGLVAAGARGQTRHAGRPRLGSLARSASGDDPVTAEVRTFVDIDATAERVWEVLTDLRAYAEWNPFITEAEGTIAAGERLSVSAPPVNAFVPARLRPTVVEV